MENLSRRHVLAAAAATVTLPMLQAALGRMKSAQAATPAGGAASAPASASAPAWFTTKLKAADLKDGDFAGVDGHKIVVSRSDKTVLALTTVCPHKQQTLPTKATKTIVCPAHKSEFNLDGSIVKGPATKPLDTFAIRVNPDGLIEIDPGTKPAKGAANASVTLS